jgi:hypothetical protein
MTDVYHTFTCTIGVRAKRSKNKNSDAITGLTLSGAYVNKPDMLESDVRLVRVTLELPESLFQIETKVKGRLESRLQDEYTALIEELTDAD